MDDDDAATSDPEIITLLWSWDGSSGEFQFDMAVTDPGCDLGNPVVNWSINGAAQTPATLGGAAMACQATIVFTVSGLTSGTWDFGFSITDSVGNTSPTWSVTVTN
jgi:hypothetical protein